MNKALLKQSLMLLLLLAICFGGLVSLMLNGRHSVTSASNWVQHSHTIIAKVEKVDILLERMLADERSYRLSGHASLKEDYQKSKKEINDEIAGLLKLTADEKAQTVRFENFNRHFLLFSKALDAHIEERNIQASPGEPDDTAILTSLKENLVRINDSVLQEEASLLSARIHNVQALRNRSFAAILTGCLITIVLLMVFHAVMFNAQQGRMAAEGRLRDSEETFRLALEGAQDGIFDWNLKTGAAFYTRPFWTMLGYEPNEMPQTIETFYSLMHPEDRPRIRQLLEEYLAGKIPEYSAVFRMQHKNGRWIWVNSRGKAIGADGGPPARMVGAQTDISTLKAYEEKLEKARDRAENASRTKSEFLAHMSHEIRTPLTAISGIAEILGRHQKNLDDKQKLLVKTLSSSSSLLSELISDILDFSKIESGEIKLEDSVFGLAELFDHVVSVTAMAAREKNLEFSFDYNEVRNVKFRGDKTRLRQILINLIGNAIKFTNKGSVSVRAYKHAENGAEKLRIDVSDTGIGIDPAHFDLVFEQFKQADSSVARKYGGSGLGLAISLRLARMMDGSILLTSALDKGSTFSLVIPFRTEETQTESSRAAQRDPAFPANSVVTMGKRVLLAEDYEGNVVMLGYILDSMGCLYDVVATGHQALEKWKQTGYDLILMDVQMPDMDGLTATAQIRQQEKESNRARVPIIGMTAHVRPEDKEKCIEAGMDVYLPKPIIESELKSKITACLMNVRQAA